MTDNNKDRGRPRGGRSGKPRFDHGPRHRDGREFSKRDFKRDKPKGFDQRRGPRPEPAQEVPVEAPSAPQEERIAKVIARAGVASRRDAEAMIGEGRVTLNGELLTSPAVNVTARDRITVDGEPLPAKERTRLWLFHKPRGLVTTARDPEGRATVFESLPEDLPRVVTIGRLDINTEGLLLLTNDGGLARVIAHPETGWMRRYKVRAHGDITQAELDQLRHGITIEGMEYGPIEATLDRVQGDNVWITMGLREGKNREIKNILEHLGLKVNRLIRLSFGPFQLGDLEPGLVEEVRTKVLKEQLGTKLAQEAGVDFESPVREPIAPFKSERHEERRGASVRQDERREEGGRFRRERHPGGVRDRSERDFLPRDERQRRPERRPHGTVWRDEANDGLHSGRKAPRRGGDAKTARAASAERPRERVGAIEAGERKVTVERLVSEKRSRREHPPGERPRRAPSGDDRPRRHAGEDRGFRGRPRQGRDGDEHSRGPPGHGGRSNRPQRGGNRNEGQVGRRDERPRGPSRGGGREDRPPRSRFRSEGPSNAPGGFRKGARPARRPGPKGPPRGRRS